MRVYYEDDWVTLYHGDCRDVLPGLGLGKVDLMLTDPPYGIGWSRGVNSARNSKPHAGIANDEDTTVRDAVLRLTSAIPAIVFGSFYAPFPERLKQILVWKKPDDSGVVGSVTGYRRDVEPIFLIGEWPMRHVKWSGLLPSFAGGMAAITAATGHPHTKPVGLVRSLIERTDAQTILDPFMGSGTTLVAAKQLGRKSVGVEICESYCEIAAKRLEQNYLNFGPENQIEEGKHITAPFLFDGMAGVANDDEV